MKLSYVCVTAFLGFVTSVMAQEMPFDECCDSGECATCFSPCQEMLSPRLRFSAGADLTFVKPRFVTNPAFTTLESDGASRESFRVTDFAYDTELAPRVWLLFDSPDGLGLRAQYWQFDQSPGARTTSPDDNGFGEITHPSFGSVDIGTTVPTDQFRATSNINAYAIDIEAIKALRSCDWGLTMGGGIRFASMEQSYFAELHNGAGDLRGRIDYAHLTDGVGPTVAVVAHRYCGRTTRIYSLARGSVLMGDTTATLEGIEDADLVSAINTSSVESRDGFLPIGELQVGLETYGQFPTGQRAFARIGLEGQLWGDVGNASQLDGNIGFVGFHVGIGLTR